MEYHLELFKADNLIYSNNGRWLYPLFDVENYIIKEKLSLESLLLKDKIAGRAAAFLMCKIGFKKVHIGLLSRLGKDVFDKHGVTVTWDELTDKINCKTESLLKDINDTEEAYKLLKKRAGLFNGIEINCKNLSCGYNNSKVLSGINLTVPEGGTLLVLGENGEGKTTFLKTIAGINRQITGDVIFKRKEKPIHINRGQIGFLSQNSNNKTMPILVRELLDVTATLLGLKGEEKSYTIEISLRRCGALDLYNRAYYELSGGERQRVNIARLICQRAGLFILDEPTNHLDSRGRETLIELISDIHEREMPTILIASHDEILIKNLPWKTLNIKKGGIEYGTIH